MNKFWKDWLDEDYKIVRKRKEIQNITVLIVRFLTSELPDYLFVRTRSKNTHKFVGDKQYWEFILIIISPVFILKSRTTYLYKKFMNWIFQLDFSMGLINFANQLFINF